MRCVKVLLLLLSPAASSHAYESQSFESHELTELYDIILKENSTMNVNQHVSWAQGVHMGASQNPSLDDALGYVETTGERSYQFITYRGTIKIIRNHTDVLSAKPAMDPMSQHQYIVCVPEDTPGVANIAAWANTVHTQDQKEHPDSDYKGITMELRLSDERWCFLGSFSDRAIARVRLHPQVDIVASYQDIVIHA